MHSQNPNGTRCGLENGFPTLGSMIHKTGGMYRDTGKSRSSAVSSVALPKFSPPARGKRPLGKGGILLQRRRSPQGLNPEAGWKTGPAAGSFSAPESRQRLRAEGAGIPFFKENVRKTPGNRLSQAPGSHRRTTSSGSHRRRHPRKEPGNSPKGGTGDSARVNRPKGS